MHRLRSRVTTALPLLIVSLCVAQLCAAQQLVLTPFKPGGIYALGEKAGWDVRMLPDGTHRGDYEYTVRRNNFDLIKSGKLDLSRPATIAVTLDEPAMLYVEVRSSDPAARVYLVGAAIAPEKLQPVVPRPRDFDRFWTDKIKLLEKIPVNPKVTPRDSGKEGVDYFTLQLDHINGKHVYGQLARPSKEGKYPGLVIFQWASPPYPLQKEWVTERAAEGWVALNIEPHEIRRALLVAARDGSLAEPDECPLTVLG